MNSKTAAEQQLEFLRKLKEKQKGAVKKSAARDAPPASNSTPAGRLTLKRSAKNRRGFGIPVGEGSWVKLKEQSLASGKLRLNKELGNWAVELLLGVPHEVQFMSSEFKSELFEKVKAWVESRGLK